MTQLLGLFHIGLAIFIAALVLVQGLRHRTELLSIRNLFLLGFIIFQVTSAATTFLTGDYGEMPVTNPAVSGLWYTVIAVLFLFLYLTTYAKGWVANWLAARTPVAQTAPSPSALLGLALLITLAGVGIRLFGASVFGPGAQILGAALLAVAGGLAGWVWAPRMFNPVVLVLIGCIVVSAMGALLLTSFGRRDMLAFLAAFLWTAYYAHWRYLGLRAVAVRFGSLALAGTLFLAAYTAVRGGDPTERTNFAQIRQANVLRGIKGLAFGQYGAANSIYFVESRPGSQPYDTLHSARYFVLQPVPRAFIPWKPEGLGYSVVKEVGIRNKAPGYNIGPGIVGHIANDNPWLTLVPYAVFLGIVMRYGDQMVRRHPYNPFVIIPIGSSLGQFLGLARGELGLFLFWGVSSVLVSIIVMYIAGKLLSPFSQPLAEPETQDDPAYEEFEGDLDYPEQVA